MVIIQISLAVIALCTLLLTAGALVVIFGAWRAVKALRKQLEEFKEEFRPMAERVQETVEHARLVAEDVLDTADGFSETLSGVHGRAERMGALFKVLEEDMERATLRLFSFMSGLGRFLRATVRGRGND